MTSTAPTRPRRPPDRSRLLHSRGFRVDTPSRKLGYVEDVIEPRNEVDGALVVRAGRIRSRYSLVPLDEVIALDAHQWQIVVRDDRRQSDAGLLAEWRRRRAAANRPLPEDALSR